MIYRLIIAKVYHDRVDEFVALVKERWAPLLEQHGGKLITVLKNAEPTAHEIVGLMKFESKEILAKANEELQHDERFKAINAKMRPMLQSNEIRLLEPV